MSVYRIYVEKKPEYAVEAKNLLSDVKTALRLDDLRNIRILNRYDAEGLSKEDFELAITNVFSEPAVDVCSRTLPQLKDTESLFAVEFLPGQFDQRADSCEQCIQILTQGERCRIRNARIYIIDGKLDPAETAKLKSYIINPVESREASLDDGGDELGIGVAPKVEQRFNHLGEDAHATVLLGSLRIHQMQHVRKTRLTSVGSNPREIRRLGGRVERIAVAYPVGHHISAVVNLDAVIDDVAVFGFSRGEVHVGKRCHFEPRFTRYRGAQTIGFDEMQTQPVGTGECAVFAMGDEPQHVAGHEPRHQGKLLHGIEVVHAGRIAALFFVRPKGKLPFGLFLPNDGRLGIHAEELGIDVRLGNQPRADDVGPVRSDRARGDRCSHIKHPATLSKRQVVLIDIPRRGAR